MGYDGLTRNPERGDPTDLPPSSAGKDLHYLSHPPRKGTAERLISQFIPDTGSRIALIHADGANGRVIVLKRDSNRTTRAFECLEGREFGGAISRTLEWSSKP